MDLLMLRSFRISFTTFTS